MSITFRTDPNYTADLYTFLNNAEGSVPHVGQLGRGRTHGSC